MSDSKYQVWSRYGFEDEKLLDSNDDLDLAIETAEIEAGWMTPDVRVWEQLEDGEMVDVYSPTSQADECVIDEY